MADSSALPSNSSLRSCAGRGKFERTAHDLSEKSSTMAALPRSMNSASQPAQTPTLPWLGALVRVVGGPRVEEVGMCWLYNEFTTPHWPLASGPPWTTPGRF